MRQKKKAAEDGAAEEGENNPYFDYCDDLGGSVFTTADGVGLGCSRTSYADAQGKGEMTGRQTENHGNRGRASAPPLDTWACQQEGDVHEACYAQSTPPSTEPRKHCYWVGASRPGGNTQKVLHCDEFEGVACDPKINTCS
jgi:hypothetical protein